MKKLWLSFAFLLAVITLAQAQKAQPLSKEDEKKMKKQKKEMDVMAFKTMYEEYTLFKREKTKLEQELSRTNKLADEKQSSIGRLTFQKDSIANARKQLVSSQPEGVGKGGLTPEDFTHGRVYKVQVGDVKGAKLDEQGILLLGNKNLSVERDFDGALKYTLGYFKSVDEAQQFKDYLEKIGLKTVYFIAYDEGKRVSKD